MILANPEDARETEECHMHSVWCLMLAPLLCFWHAETQHPSRGCGARGPWHLLLHRHKPRGKAILEEKQLWERGGLKPSERRGSGPEPWGHSLCFQGPAGTCKRPLPRSRQGMPFSAQHPAVSGLAGATLPWGCSVVARRH